MSDPHTTPATTAPAKHDAMHDIDSPGTLLVVFGVIITLFFATLALSSSGMMGKYALFGQLAIGAVQATFVGYSFMHLRHGDRIVILTALASIFWMGILFVLFMSDYMTRNRVVG